ncbi:hypothetical protein Q8A73_001343 [Channa argus]|nr:hypothetical protein Q8A73_001343 [Channa argus]
MRDEPKTREDFLKYACQLILDVNSVHPNLHLSEGNRTVTMKSEPKNYPDHPDRSKVTHPVTTGLRGAESNSWILWSVSWRLDAKKSSACSEPYKNSQTWRPTQTLKLAGHICPASVPSTKPLCWKMSIWMILPVSLPVLTITGIWVVYAMALYNQHVCPVDNWLYNQSCKEDLHLQTGPTLCCTLDNVPLISKCGTHPPESCFFSLICSTGSFMVMVIVLLRYAHVIEKHQNCVLNTASLSTGWICAAGLIMVGNFQVDNAKVLHYVGAGIAFPTSMLFVCLQSGLTYRLAKTQGEYNVAHLRLLMTLLAFVTLVLSGVFFCQESFILQHASAIFEWVFCVIVMLFYGTFAFEFAGMSGDTMVVLARGGALGPAGREHKMDALGAQPHSHQTENMSIL